MNDEWNRYDGALFMCTFYIYLGFFAAACNIINILIILSNKELRQRWVYMIALNIGELVNAISFVLVGYGRKNELQQGTLFCSFTVAECFQTKYWTHSLILGTELPAYMMILVSCERFMAVFTPVKYKLFFQQSQKYILLLTVPIVGVCSLLLAWLSAHIDGERVVQSRHCFIIDSTAAWYSTFHFVIVVVAFLVSFLSFFAAWRIGKRFAHGSVTGKKHKLGLWMAMSISSMILMSLPSFVMVCKSRTSIQFDDVIVALTYAMPGFLSIFSTVMNFTLHSEFRQQFIYLLRMHTFAARTARRNPSQQTSSKANRVRPSLEFHH